MNFRKRFVNIMIILLLSGASLQGVPQGPGEVLIKSRNCPEGIAVSTLETARTIVIGDADARRMTGLFGELPESSSLRTEPGAESLKLRKREAMLHREQLFTREHRGIPGKETVMLRDMVRLNLFKGLEVTALLSRVDQTGYSFTWVGSVEGKADRGTVHITVADEEVLGRVLIYGEGIFSIASKGPDLFEITEMDFSKARFAPPLHPPEGLFRDTSPGPDVSLSSDGIIEIMIVWSQDAQAGAAQSGTSIQAEIAMAVSLINTTYANSGINQRASLVESAGTGYVSSGNSETDLYRLQNPNDGYMDEIHLLRQASRADCVALITNGFSSNIIGQGFALLPQYQSYFSHYAFSVVDRHAFSYQTLTHELGHNMGAGHELDNPSSPGPQYYSYSSGYHYKVSDLDHWHTMMSYRHEGSYKIEHFSNPGVSFEGNPTGLPGPSGNNNALTLNNTMGLVDSFGTDLDPDLESCYLYAAYFEPGSVESGDTLDISIRVCNNGNGPATGFSVDFYASANTGISEDDYFLGSAYSPGISLGDGYAELSWSGPLPRYIPSGSYYIGWIIDADDDVPESNEDNNTGLITSPRLTVAQANECTYSISPSNQVFSASGGNGSLNVLSQPGCYWSAESLDYWIIIPNGTEGSGSGSVIYQVQPNSSYFQRTGRIRIEGEYLTIVQQGAIPDCSVNMDPESRTHEAGEGSGTITITVPSVCEWSAAGLAEWITITSGQEGTGNGTIIYTVGENRGTDERSGMIQVNEASFSVLQKSPYTALERSDRIVFPADFTQFGTLLDNTFVGAAVMNLNEEDAKGIIFSGRDREGTALETNSSLSNLQPKGQLARLTSELIELSPQISTVTGSGGGNGHPVRGIFVAGDNLTKRMEGIGNLWTPSRELYLLQGWEEPGQVTTIFLYNTSTAATAEVILEWTDRDGSLIDSATRDIHPEGTLFQTLSGLFSFSPDSRDGYLKVTSSAEICGFTLIATEESFIAFPSRVPSDTDALYAPHFIILPDGSGTEIQLINAGEIPVSLTFQAYEDPGTEFESQATILLPGAMLRGSLTDYLPIDIEGMEEGGILTGKFRISISITGNYDGFEAPRIIGGLTLSGSANNSAGLPLEKTGWKKTLFPHVAQSVNMDIFTGLSIWNINSLPAEIRVLARDRNGQVSAVKDLILDPNQRRIGLLNEDYYFGPEFSQVGGHLEISSDQPVISFCLYGDFAMEYLSTIAGQELRD